MSVVLVELSVLLPHPVIITPTVSIAVKDNAKIVLYFIKLIPFTLIITLLLCEINIKLFKTCCYVKIKM
ncbi:hypothetical protein CBU01nite_03620 [Clostridium butyricum]|nr:hypothetical protein CBU01nite_03620 [Clostridium butyricum]